MGKPGRILFLLIGVGLSVLVLSWFDAGVFSQGGGGSTSGDTNGTTAPGTAPARGSTAAKEATARSGGDSSRRIVELAYSTMESCGRAAGNRFDRRDDLRCDATMLERDEPGLTAALHDGALVISNVRRTSYMVRYTPRGRAQSTYTLVRGASGAVGTCTPEGPACPETTWLP